MRQQVSPAVVVIVLILVVVILAAIWYFVYGPKKGTPTEGDGNNVTITQPSNMPGMEPMGPPPSGEEEGTEGGEAAPPEGGEEID